jgi:hypothetical protein
MIIDKKNTPIYDFECDHDADENYWCIFINSLIPLKTLKYFLTILKTLKFWKLEEF